MIDVIHGSSDKPVASQELAKCLRNHLQCEGTLYIGYPIIGSIDGAYEVDALLITKEHGIIAFLLVEDRNIPIDNPESQDNCFTLLESKLKSYKELSVRRQLQVEINTVTFAPAASNLNDMEEGYYFAKAESDLLNIIDSISWSSPEYFEKVVSVIQAVSRFKTVKKRTNVTSEESRGGVLKKLESSISNLDVTQNKAVLETVDGVQRIRGLAGSGKTVVLARKIAYLHAKHPEWNIAISFNSRSLKRQFEQLITSFVFEQSAEEPDWEKISILHAWGSNSSYGLYYLSCLDNEVEFVDFTIAKRKSAAGQSEFDYVCQEFLDNCPAPKERYDLILIDEAQDFSKSYLQLCYKLLKGKKRLVYAYDELQTLNDASMPPAEEIWGTLPDGKPLVSLESASGEPRKDVILECCYRNPGPTLATAHAIGFGVYRPEGMVQMFDYAPLWQEIGYEVLEGKLEDNQVVVLGRSRSASPIFLENHSSINDLLSFNEFQSDHDQIQWLVESIEKNLTDDQLNPDDIMVIHTDPLTTRDAVSKARALLSQKAINSTLAGVTSSPDTFFEKGAIVFTSIYRAKGNEAAMVYVINAQKSASGDSLARKRNILFTAMTRTKAWLRVSGFGAGMTELKAEYDAIRANNFKLKFIYPDEEARRHLRVVNRDMTSKEKNIIARSERGLMETAERLLSGEIHKEDLSPDVLEKLKKALNL